ncbi:hypothetical protein FACS1894200_07130 [Spirochaetia bacterium]|nr:hypothetical protein FACS1894200_07130 [Spirochaetia bacterium]
MSQTVTVPRGEALGIGTFKVSQNQNFDYVIPILSFSVIKESDNHLRIDGYGKTEKQASDTIIENALFFLLENFTAPQCKDQGWQNLADLFKTDEWSNELWDAYHAVKIELSMQGRETDTIASLRERIDRLEMRVTRLESEESQQAAKELAAIKKY